APWFDALADLVQIHSLNDAIIMLLAAVLSAAVFEEMLFRGLLQHTLEHFQSPAIAIIVSALFFAVAHFSLWTAVQIMVLGLVLGYVAWKSGTILPSMMIHALNNLFSLIMMNSPAASLDWYHSGHVRPIWLVFAIALCLPAYRFFNKSCKKNATLN
ncbi:CPBP family intramembrane metalloprotease, partial [candidate division KSB1 bacterium]